MNCFRACDVRGIYPNEVNEQLFAGLGAAIASRWARGHTVLLGYDCRTASQSLKLALAAGLSVGGAKPLDAGRIPTPMVYFGKRMLDCPVACIVTASHNPSEYHGLKLLLPNGAAQPDDIRWLKDNWECFGQPYVTETSQCVNVGDAYEEYLRKTWRQLGRDNRPLRIIVDPGNGAWSGLAPRFLSSLGIDCRAIHDLPDGRFPSRPPDCADPANLGALRKVVLETGADAGIAWDGDGDRLALVDDLGKPLSSDQIALLLLPRVLAGTTGEKVLLDVKMSRRVAQLVRDLCARPVMQGSAHCALEQTMRSEDCIFGCEYSGHFFFRDLGGADDGLVAALQVLKCICGGQPKLSHLVAGLPPMFITSDIRIPGSAAEFDNINVRLSSAFSERPIDRLDGLKVALERASILVRASVSEDKLSFRIEADSAEDLSQTALLLLRLLPEHRQHLGRHLERFVPAGIS